MRSAGVDHLAKGLPASPFWKQGALDPAIPLLAQDVLAPVEASVSTTSRPGLRRQYRLCNCIRLRLWSWSCRRPAVPPHRRTGTCSGRIRWGTIPIGHLRSWIRRHIIVLVFFRVSRVTLPKQLDVLIFSNQSFVAAFTVSTSRKNSLVETESLLRAFQYPMTKLCGIARNPLRTLGLVLALTTRLHCMIVPSIGVRRTRTVETRRALLHKSPKFLVGQKKSGALPDLHASPRRSAKPLPEATLVQTHPQLIVTTIPLTLSFATCTNNTPALVLPVVLDPASTHMRIFHERQKAVVSSFFERVPGK